MIDILFEQIQFNIEMENAIIIEVWLGLVSFLLYLTSN